jgi:hypothetical protein
MSIRQRIGFAVLAAVVAAVAVVLLRPEESSERADDPGERSAQRDGGGRGTGGGPAAEPEQPAAPPVQRIALEGGQVSGGPQDVTVTSGEQVTVVVSSDTPDEIHLHGYDLTQDTAPGDPARFRFEANIEGSFEIESHTAEDAGLEARIANLVVKPS